MKKYILTILPMIMVSFECFGGMLIGFQLGEEKSNSCNVTELGVSEEEEISDMEARFSPNIISVKWAGTQNLAGANITTVNQYDSKVTKPMGEKPKKTGYKFVGWKVSGVKTCADFSAEDFICKEHQNCIWKDNACVQNPCIECFLELSTDGTADMESEICVYQEYNYETNSCRSRIDDADLAE